MARPARFDRATVARAGLAVVRDHGWAGLTLASAADALGVTPMALYRVVDDAEELHRVVADRAGALCSAAPTGPLLDELRAWAVDAHRQLAGLGGLAAYVAAEWTELPAWLDIVETFLGHAAAEDLDGPAAVHTVNAVFAYVLARCQLRDGVTPRRRLAPVTPGTYPNIHANLQSFRVAQTDTAFEFGLDALVAGLRSTVGLQR